MRSVDTHPHPKRPPPYFVYERPGHVFFVGSQERSSPAAFRMADVMRMLHWSNYDVLASSRIPYPHLIPRWSKQAPRGDGTAAWARAWNTGRWRCKCFTMPARPRAFFVRALWSLARHSRADTSTRTAYKASTTASSLILVVQKVTTPSSVYGKSRLTFKLS